MTKWFQFCAIIAGAEIRSRPKKNRVPNTGKILNQNVEGLIFWATKNRKKYRYLLRFFKKYLILLTKLIFSMIVPIRVRYQYRYLYISTKQNLFLLKGFWRPSAIVKSAFLTYLFTQLMLSRIVLIWFQYVFKQKIFVKGPILEAIEMRKKCLFKVFF